MNILLNGLRYFDKYTLNRVMLKVAGRNRLPFAVIYHVGRRSKKAYRTPILVEPLGCGFVVTLTYGPETDWYRNALAAGEYTILWHGKKYRMQRMEIVDAETALPAFPLPVRLALRAVGIRHFARLG